MTSSSPKTLLLFRYDLRLSDHPALHWAVQHSDKIIPAFIWDIHHHNSLGSASKWWLHHSLLDLEESLKKISGTLLIRKGDTVEEIKKIHAHTPFNTICVHQNPHPDCRNLNNNIADFCRNNKIAFKLIPDADLIEPDKLLNKEQNPFRVFTPFYNNALQNEKISHPLPTPTRLTGPTPFPDGLTANELQLLTGFPWYKKLETHWSVGETAGKEMSDLFINNSLKNYPKNRDLPAISGTSKLSPYLAFGNISSRQVHQWLQAHPDNTPFIRQLYWREFARYILHHFPHVQSEPLYTEWKNFPIETNTQHLKQWQKGETGYPIIDAGMRELWETGWMHNRVRMIVASFLIKDLHISYKEGEAWFWDTLVDADLANNNLGWQWSAGCGVDAQPYFRIFNPTLQSKKFDPNGHYIRKWIPELKHLSDTNIHEPWRITDRYIKPIVDHHQERDKTLALYEQFKSEKQ